MSDVETLAGYLARCMVAELGFTTDVVPEAAPLTAACDHVLTRRDGMTMTIACLVDRDRDPDRRFGLEPQQLDEVAMACRRYAGAIYGSRQPITIEIWEIGAGVTGDSDGARLGTFTFRARRKPGASVLTFAIDSAAGTLVSTATVDESTRRRAWLARQLARTDRNDLPQRPAVAAIPDRRPIATWILLATLVVGFVLELVWAPVPSSGALSPDIRTHYIFGGLNHRRVADGEWWRLLTSVWLHGGIEHVALNCVALLMAGSVLEKLVGRGWMLAVFFVGAVGGSAMSLAINPDSLLTVGASGAIMAMLAAAMVAARRIPDRQARHSIMVSLGYILVPSLLPLFTHGGGDHVDYADHVGGALAGGALGLIMLLGWPSSRPSPRGRMLASLVAALGAVAVAIGFGIVAADWKHNVHDNVFELIPNSELADVSKITPQHAAELAQRYPRDPRSHLFVALHALDGHDAARAAASARQGLSERAILTQLPDLVEVGLREALAVAVLIDDSPDEAEARRAITPVCAQKPMGVLAPDVRTRLCAPP